MTNRSSTTRLRLRPWREPRLVLGVLLVLGATVLGARLAAAGDDTVEYWAVRSAVTPGDTVTESMLEPTRIRLSGTSAANYVRTDEEFDAPLDELVWAHALSEGSLVGKTSLVARAGRSHGELPLSVAEGAAPGDLRRGDLVDVWVGPGPGDDPATKAVRVLEAVKVLQTGDDAAALGGALAQTVLVEVDEERLGTSVVGTVSAGHVTLVRVS
ncbi:MAG: hypothetical protein ABW004_14725 [Aeromicrobium sp.]|jgi:hypothetical protein